MKLIQISKLKNINTINQRIFYFWGYQVVHTQIELMTSLVKTNKRRRKESACYS